MANGVAVNRLCASAWPAVDGRSRVRARDEGKGLGPEGMGPKGDARSGPGMTVEKGRVESVD